MSSQQDLFSSFKNFAFTCKYMGLGPYIIKNNNQYVIKITILDVIILILLMGLSVFFEFHQFLVLDYTAQVFQKHWTNVVQPLVIYTSFVIMTATNSFCGLQNRKINYEILCKINVIFDELHIMGVNINFKLLKRITFGSLLIILSVTLISWSISVITNGVNLNMFNYFFMLIIPMLLETQFIFCLIVVSYILQKLNNVILNDQRNLKLLQYYSYEVFSICELVNRSFNHILMRILVTFMTTTVSASWVVILILEDDCTPFFLIGTSIWVLSHNIGVSTILFFTCFLRFQVRYLIYFHYAHSTSRY